jgi:hypothetical protein
MGPKFSESSSRIMAFDNAVQAMYHNKVTPDAGAQYWGAPQVIHLHEKCMGTPVFNVYPYPTSFNIKGARQYNTLVHCRVQLVVQRISRSAPTHSWWVIDLFDIQSSQESRDDHALPPLLISIITRRESRGATSQTLSNAAASVRRLSLVERRTTMTMRTTMMKGITRMTGASSFSLDTLFIT